MRPIKLDDPGAETGSEHNKAGRSGHEGERVCVRAQVGPDELFNDCVHVFIVIVPRFDSYWGCPGANPENPEVVSGVLSAGESIPGAYDHYMRLVADDFVVPLSFRGAGFRMEPLGPQHNKRDHDAWMSSIDHIRETPDFLDADWPTAMTLDSNLADLVRHADDFENRSGFTYSILDGDDVIGCVYIYPSTTADVSVSSWVRASRAEMDVVTWQAISSWLKTDWPFPIIEYGAR